MTNTNDIDGRAAHLKETESVTFRLDTASKKLLQVHALTAGFRNVSEYLRHISVIPPKSPGAS